MNIHEKSSPIEVWLIQKNMAIACHVVHEDESVETLDIDALSMRGAQREITGWLIGQGYAPVARWEYEDTDGAESVRRFAIK